MIGLCKISISIKRFTLTHFNKYKRTADFTLINKGFKNKTLKKDCKTGFAKEVILARFFSFVFLAFYEIEICLCLLLH